MADPTLTTFVENALRTGAPRDEIQRVLEEAGWSRDQVKSALAAYSAVDFPVPVPRPSPQLSARDAFLYLVMFSMLFISAFNFGSLLFIFIDIAIPDPLSEQYGDYVGVRIRQSVAALLVAFPVFLYITMRISRSVAEHPTQRSSGVRKWLTYVTLAIAACVIVGDLISILYSLLSGEMTVRFALKSGTVGLISGAIFGYYLWWMRTDEKVLEQ
jgi:hypothetical protein